MMILSMLDAAAERSQVLTLSAIQPVYGTAWQEHTPAVIPDEQMEQFKFMLDYSDEAVEMCTAPLAQEVNHRWSRSTSRSGRRTGGSGWKSESGGKTGLLGCAGVDMPVGFVEDEIRMADARKCEEFNSSFAVERRAKACICNLKIQTIIK